MFFVLRFCGPVTSNVVKEENASWPLFACLRGNASHSHIRVKSHVKFVTKSELWLVSSELEV